MVVQLGISDCLSLDVGRPPALDDDPVVLACRAHDGDCYGCLGTSSNSGGTCAYCPGSLICDSVKNVKPVVGNSSVCPSSAWLFGNARQCYSLSCSNITLAPACDSIRYHDSPGPPNNYGDCAWCSHLGVCASLEPVPGSTYYRTLCPCSEYSGSCAACTINERCSYCSSSKECRSANASTRTSIAQHREPEQLGLPLPRMMFGDLPVCMGSEWINWTNRDQQCHDRGACFNKTTIADCSDHPNGCIWCNSKGSCAESARGCPCLDYYPSAVCCPLSFGPASIDGVTGCNLCLQLGQSVQALESECAWCIDSQTCVSTSSSNGSLAVCGPPPSSDAGDCWLLVSALLQWICAPL